MTDMSSVVNALQTQNTILTSILSQLAKGVAILPPLMGAYQANPTNPAGTTNLTGLMMGLAGSIKPAVTGKISITIAGSIANASAIADGGATQIRYGTGSAPANAAALTGTAVGPLVRYVAATTAQIAPFSLQAIVTGLTLQTTYWIDLSLAAITGGTATVSNLSISATELY